MANRPLKSLIVRAPDVEPFSTPGDEHVYLSQCIVDHESVGSNDLNVNRGTLKAGQKIHGGSHPAGADECYYVIRGHARLALGGDPHTGEGGETFEVGPEDCIFIPGGTYHALDNPYQEDLVILTLWPRLPKPGDNPMYDARLAAWGTSFRMRTDSE